MSVTMREATRKGARGPITERLYECSNGLAVGARRGGALHLAGKDSWEVFTIVNGVPRESAGYVTDAYLALHVQAVSEMSA